MNTLLKIRNCVKILLFLFISLFMGIFENAQAANFSTIPIIVNENTEVCCYAANLSFDLQDIRIHIRDGVGEIMDSGGQDNVFPGSVALPVCLEIVETSFVRCTFSAGPGRNAERSFRGYMCVESGEIGGPASECRKTFEATRAPTRRFTIP